MKRFLSLLLAVIMCVSMVPMTLIDALAHGRGVAGNDIENQSLTNMSQLPEQVTVDGKTDDTAWDALKWNVADSATGTWDVKDPLNSDYTYKYQLRKDGEYFYGIIVLAKKDATVKVLINDGTNDNAGYTDYLKFDVKADGTLTAQHSFADAEGTLPAEAYKHASAINDQGRIVIEFRTLIKSFSESSDLSCFVSSSIEGKEGTETLYYPRVPYTNGNHDVPTATYWPEDSIKVDLVDITGETKNNNAHVLPSMINIDGEFKDAAWSHLTNYYSEQPDSWRNPFDFKEGDSSNPLAYKPAEIRNSLSQLSIEGNDIFTSGNVDQSSYKFKYTYYYDNEFFYIGAVLLDEGTTSNTEPYLYLYTHYGDYPETTDSPSATPDDTFVISRCNDMQWHYDSQAFTGFPGAGTGMPEGFQSNVFYLDANLWGFEAKVPISAIWSNTYSPKDGVSFSMKITSFEGTRYDTNSNGVYDTFSDASARNSALAYSREYGQIGGTSYYHYRNSIRIEGIENYKNLAGNGLGGYDSGEFNQNAYPSMLAAEAGVDASYLGSSKSAGKGQQIYADMAADYEYLYGAAIINTSSFNKGAYGANDVDVFRVYIKDTEDGQNTLASGGDSKNIAEPCDKYLSFYLDENGNPRVVLTQHKGKYDNRGQQSQWKAPLTDGEGIGWEELTNADVAIKTSKLDSDTVQVLVEFRVPLYVLDVTVDYNVVTNTRRDILNWYVSIENLADFGSKGLVYPHTGNYSYFYEGDEWIDGLKSDVFYLNYWHEQRQGRVSYDRYNSTLSDVDNYYFLDSINIDGKLDEAFWDSTDDMINVSQYNGIWETEPKGNSVFSYDYRIFNTPDHIYGAAVVDFPVNAKTTKFRFWTQRDAQDPKYVTISVDKNGTASATITANGKTLPIVNDIVVKATSINNRSVIEFSMKNNRANLGAYNYAVSVTHITEDGEELTLFHLGNKDGWNNLWQTHYNPSDIDKCEGAGVITSFDKFSTIYNDTYQWWDYYLFAPAEGYGEGVYEVKAIALGAHESVANPVSTILAAASGDTTGWFVYSINMGNRGKFDYTSSSSNDGSLEYRRDFTVGAKVYFDNIDLENFERIYSLSDENIDYYESGYYNTAKYKVYTATENFGNANLPSETKWHKNAEKVQSLGFYNREIITVDGELGDSGWDEGRWTEVVGDINGSYQSTTYRGAEKSDFRYQMRTDGKFIYVAAIINTDILGQSTAPEKEGETVTKLTDLPSFRIWIRGDDDTDSSMTFTHLYDVALNTSYGANSYTIEGVHTTYYEGEDGAKVESASGDYYTLSNGKLAPKSLYTAIDGSLLYPQLRYAKTNELGWARPHGGNPVPVFDENGKVTLTASKADIKDYSSSAMFGYTEKTEENTVSGLSEKNEWYSEPVTEKVTFGNEHGMIKYYGNYDAEYGDATIVEFKIGLDEIDKDRSGFEYFVHASNSGYGDSNPYTVFYPSVSREPRSAQNFMMYNLPYWKWYSEHSYKVDADEYEYMMLRDSYGPVTTLGAKIIDNYNNNAGVKAIRFGAYYNEDFIRWPSNVKNASQNTSSTLDADKDGVLNYWDIAEVGMLIAPTQLLPDNTGLTHETDVKYLDAVADPITNWIKGSNLADYDTMVFHVPVKNIPTSMKFTFVPYVDYYDNNGTETYYGIPAERSYDYVLNVLGGSMDAAKVRPFWITHMNAPAEYEGSGTIFTTPYSGFAWGIHIAFAPTEIDGIYKIVEITDGTTGGSAGQASPLAIPEGGFVWTATYGNDWPAINGTGIDYETEGAKVAIDLAREWVVGDTIAFYNWTLENGYNIPTTTPTLEWYDDEYVCTATVEKVDILPEPEESEPEEESSEAESSEESSEAEESSEPEEESKIVYDYDEDLVAYIPLDDRPVNVDREILSAQGSDFTLLMPDITSVQTQVNKKISSSDNIFRITAFNTAIAEGHTTLYTESTNYMYPNWNIHVSFKPTTSSSIYEVVEVVDGTGTGSSAGKAGKLAIPTNGFVIESNSETNPGTVAAKTWKPGDKVYFWGLDLSSKSANQLVMASRQTDLTDVIYADSFNKTTWANGNTSIYTSSTSLANNTSLGGWNTYVVFKPYLAVPNTYEVVSISDGGDKGADRGQGVKPTSVPSGGFVWIGNETNAGSGAARTFATMRKLKAGDVVSFDINVRDTSFTRMFTGLDIDDSATGKREESFAWLQDIYENGYKTYVQGNVTHIVRPKYYVLSLDQLVSGGLAGSRNFSIIDKYYDQSKTVDENFAMFEDGVVDFLTTLAADENTYTVAFDTIMRLATATTDFFCLGDYYTPTRHNMGVVPRKLLSGSQLTLENVIYYMQRDVNGNLLDPTSSACGNLDTEFVNKVYYPSRERKVRFAYDMLTALNEAGAQFDRYYIGIDDTVPEENGVANVQSNEANFLKKLISDYGMVDSTSVFDGADELGMVGIGAVTTDRDYDGLLPVNVTYFDNNANDSVHYENYRGGAYDSMTLKESVEAHLLAAGAQAVTAYNRNNLQLLVLTRCTDDANNNITSDSQAEMDRQNAAVDALVAQLKTNLANDIPTMVINAQGSGDCRSFLYKDMLAADIDIAKIYGYSQWNTIGNAIGLAIGMGVSRFAYVQACANEGTVPTESSNVNFLASLTTAYVKDWAYRMFGQAAYATRRDEIVNWINGSPFYTALGQTSDAYTVSVGMYDCLDSWDNRDFEAQIPVDVKINYALGADYKDPTLMQNSGNTRGFFDANGNYVGYNLYTGLINDGVYGSSIASTDQKYHWYCFRSDADAVNGKVGNGTVAVNTKNRVGTIIFDLGEVRSLDEVRIQYATKNGNDFVYSPESIKIYFSETEDGYSSSADMSFSTFESAAGWYSRSKTLASAKNARFVKIEVTVSGTVNNANAFIGEIELLG